jgi:phage anti-repressor protein
MANSIVRQDIAALLDGWIEAEKNGNEFPVPFDLAWNIAGYSMKHHGKRKLISPKSQLAEGIDYLTKSGESSPEGRSSDEIRLTCDAFKQFCLLAETEEGRQIRQYFIESEKKWRLVQKVAPQVASEVEILHLRVELARQEAIARQAEERTLSLRHYITTSLPPAIGDRIMGVTEIREVKFRTKVVDESGFILNAGETLSKTELAHRYGFVTRSGKPDTKLVTKLVEEAIASRAIPNPWKDVRVVAAAGFDASLLDTLDRFFEANPQERQMWVGE